MKKLIVAAILCGSLAYAGELNLRGGLTGTGFNQNDNTSPINQNTKMQTGSFIGIDYSSAIPNLPEDLKFGIGLDFGAVSGRDKDFSNKSLNGGKAHTYDYKYKDSILFTVPLYALVKYEFTNTTRVTPYLIGRVGYDLASTKNEVKNYRTGETNDVKIKNGFYYGVGAGIKLTNWSFELSYNSTETKTTYEDRNYKIDNSKKTLQTVGLSAGYAFKF